MINHCSGGHLLSYTRTGFGNPSPPQRSGVYWAPLSTWATLTKNFPANEFQVTDSYYHSKSTLPPRCEDLAIDSNNGYSLKCGQVYGSGPLSGARDALHNQRSRSRHMEKELCFSKHRNEFWLVVLLLSTSMWHANNIYSWDGNKATVKGLVSILERKRSLPHHQQHASGSGSKDRALPGKLCSSS